MSVTLFPYSAQKHEKANKQIQELVDKLQEYKYHLFKNSFHQKTLY